MEIVMALLLGIFCLSTHTKKANRTVELAGRINSGVATTDERSEFAKLTTRKNARREAEKILEEYQP